MNKFKFEVGDAFIPLKQIDRRIGVVQQVDYEKRKVLVHVNADEHNEQETDWMPMLEILEGMLDEELAFVGQKNKTTEVLYE